MDKEEVSSKMLKHLDLLMDMDILEEQEIWEELLDESKKEDEVEND